MNEKKSFPSMETEVKKSEVVPSSIVQWKLVQVCFSLADGRAFQQPIKMLQTATQNCVVHGRASIVVFFSEHLAAVRFIHSSLKIACQKGQMFSKTS